MTWSWTSCGIVDGGSRFVERDERRADAVLGEAVGRDAAANEPAARSHDRLVTPTSVRFTIDSMMCAGSSGRWSVSTPLVKKSRSVAASKMPVLPAAENANTYSAPLSFWASASSLLVAGSLKPVAQPSRAWRPG